MKSFLKTWFVVFSIISGILLFFGLLFWSLSKIFGENGVPIGFAITMAFILSLFVAAAIES